MSGRGSAVFLLNVGRSAASDDAVPGSSIGPTNKNNPRLRKKFENLKSIFDKSFDACNCSKYKYASR
jgi:hypothetical protein